LNAPNLNYLWSNLIVEELVRAGVTRFSISPGSRSSSLVISAADHPRASTVVHPDERGAAFYALGYGKGTGNPAAIICTSGTAVANCLPAIVEASLSSTPLIVLTADRPVELRETGANQTIDQVKIYGNYCRWSFDLPSPSAEISPRFLLTTVDQAVYRSVRIPAGPVHLNCQFAEPLQPDPDESVPAGYLEGLDRWNRGKTPLTTYAPACPEPSEEGIEFCRKAIARARKGLIVAGTLSRRQEGRGAIADLASALRMPLLADVTSGLRFGKGNKKGTIAHYDLFLRAPEFCRKYSPDLIIHLGGPPSSNPLNAYLAGGRADYIHVNDTPFRQDPHQRVTYRIEAEPALFCRRLSDRGTVSESGLLSVFEEADRISALALEDLTVGDGDLDELSIARALLRNLPDHSGLFLANSMPARDADGCGITTDRDIAVGCNRGASGIDGTIASAAGFADGLGRRVALLIGDMAFLHDLNALLLVRDSGYPVVIILINNDGCGIFSFMPIAKHPAHFERFFGAPHGLRFREAARAFGLGYHHPNDMAGIERAFRSAFRGNKSSIIEIQTDRRKNAKRHREIWEAVAKAIRKELT